MGADREGSGRRRPARAVAYAACGVVLLAGCASMPDSGDLRGVDATPRQDTQVRVFAMPPQEDAEPLDIVQGFLEALTSDDPNYETARKYLTGNATKQWQPGLSTTVLEDGPGASLTQPVGRERTDDDTSFTLTGTRVAVVDAQQSYSPSSGDYQQTVHLVHDKKTKQWRIDSLPPGVVMGKSDFQRIYVSVNKYYFASHTKAVTAPQTVAVADPVYVRERVDPMTQLVRSLLSGPTHWLDPVVRTRFPTGTALMKGVSSLTPDDQNTLTVPLNNKARNVGSDQCEAMAAQLLFTLQNLTPAVDDVELRAGGKQLCSINETQADGAATRGSVEAPEFLYFVNGEHRLVRIPADPEGSTRADPVPVPGALGEGDKELRSVAVSRDEHMAAGVGLDGRALYVGSLVSGASLGEPVLVSAGKRADDRLTTPSWDTEGDLWVADRNPAAPRLLLFKEGAGEPLKVQTPGLDGRIKDLRVAADGVRIALVVEKGGKQSLFVGRIEREGRIGDAQSVSVRELRSTTPDLEEVTTMSWAGDSRLAVVGREQGGVQQTRYVQVDGSTPEGPPPAALTGVKEIAASEDVEMPLVAYSEDGIVRLPSGAQWQKVDADGTAPVYPG
ncbi:LpqB family beta-propeller domain-containing protein [Streptomyces sp. NBC_00285]|uniref:LpqB family beta-propeller domain-containing protein n=1 Tax=Streptomyces sp. NBC_00285 TaxID=2975700 RepID=UPI002E2E1485|nr:LpqB family beta-propeller domain-containing protein [Streptomyces sp. NBC_00285]